MAFIYLLQLKVMYRLLSRYIIPAQILSQAHDVLHIFQKTIKPYYIWYKGPGFGCQEQSHVGISFNHL